MWLMGAQPMTPLVRLRRRADARQQRRSQDVDRRPAEASPDLVRALDLFVPARGVTPGARNAAPVLGSTVLETAPSIDPGVRQGALGGRPPADQPLGPGPDSEGPPDSANGPAATARSRPHRGSSHLRWLLIGLDAVALVLSWAPLALTDQPALDHASVSGALGIAVTLTTVACILLARVKRLYLSRVATIKELERSLLVWIAVASAVFGGIVLHYLAVRVSVAILVADGALAFVVLAAERSAYRAWLKAQRQKHRFTRSTILVGANEETEYWARLFHLHPELGIEVKGVVDECAPEPGRVLAPWLGPCSQVAEIAESVGATSAFVMSAAFSVPNLRRIVRDLMRADLHVQVSLGLLGLSRGRLTVTPVAFESILYLERRSLSPRALAAKRGLDLVLATVGLALSAPLLGIVALLVRRSDGGTVLFRQQRIGKDGKPFILYKMRTMVPDAEERKKELAADNLRQGPLFKSSGDPRVTPIGRILRVTSLDELPQLINVLKGEMSLVGPRPALPEEVAQFDPELLARHEVVPGLTGLWQVEGRDDASFDSYHRLDLHYVENWSLLLDVSILASTMAAVLGRTVRAISRVHAGKGFAG